MGIRDRPSRSLPLSPIAARAAEIRLLIVEFATRAVNHARLVRRRGGQLSRH